MEQYTDIRDIKGLVPLPGLPWWIWVLLAVAVIAVLLAVWKWRSKRQAGVTETTVRLSPYEMAIESLSRLLEEKLMERELVDDFYTRLSDIVRQYLEGRFHLRAPERTTEEFLYEVSRENTLTPEHKELLGTFLQESDLVKFARFRPEKADMRRAYDAAEKFVRDTRPAVQEREAVAAG